VIIRVFAVLATVACAFAQEDVPRFRTEDVRPQGSAEPHPLVPGLSTWIFGTDLIGSPGCSAENVMVPATYKTELGSGPARSTVPGCLRPRPNLSEKC
jgi:hypothetical protein